MTQISPIYDNNDIDSSTTPTRKKSSESVINPMNVEEHGSPSMTPTPPAPVHKKSTESMIIDDDNTISSPTEGPFRLLPLDNSSHAEDSFKLPPLAPLAPLDNNNYLTIKDFNYTMGLMDDKINSLYKLCRFIGDQQEMISKSLKKLVALDELSDNFWNVSYITYL